MADITTRSAGAWTTRQQGASTEGDDVAALPAAAKVRLLTGADSWQTNGDPGIGLRSMVTSDGRRARHQ